MKPTIEVVPSDLQRTFNEELNQTASPWIQAEQNADASDELARKERFATLNADILQRYDETFRRLSQ